MKPYKIVFTGFALAQMEPLSAKDLLKIRAAAELAAANPQMFELASDHYARPYRRFHVGRYRVVYRVDEERQALYISSVRSAALPPPLESDLEASERT